MLHPEKILHRFIELGLARIFWSIHLARGPIYLWVIKVTHDKHMCNGSCNIYSHEKDHCLLPIYCT